MLSTMLRIVMLLFATGFFLYITRAINKNVFLLKNAIVWLIIAIGLIIFAIFPQIPRWVATYLGFETASNFLLFIAIIFLLVMEIKNTIIISKYENKLKTLIQELSILKSKKK
ncbi:DUF2304 domain-containing protein [Melissococcus plutonius]|uniref:DUF2304 domain-containing protein n=1 Tax=Melissococcus plutonius (strain ATCC 35311 / DSM 29964 / CIP 104052 / LMG 20360 / NCIMB 702443) TaxID=940190 RepID=F3Y9U4_MELPT|nr:DUF2304 domain-containing protein [Melissococcus plutonius]AIM24804.1 hypothetical protein MEPL_c007160 [Melissococcus plutonius S1]KMT24921.1 hypothetical protein MEPL2_2c04630 [Melissococcus plutonius]KMT26558.1 hypothetical protein MEPL3_2c02260 [Melissococcus plutonius]KMT27808.1 hypothetical protein MEPL1_3c04560 [Melissococcus plutonius]KMT29580.1 hypothetical protein MEPL4_3c04540 [Melissococcus plutonius]